MAQYLIQDTTLTDIADAIRAKTGSSDEIRVSDMASQIESISAGGGSMEGVHVVTFMSYDGTTELYKRPVADGDDCADPVTRGYISTPTKASTEQYDYSYVGWATTLNGERDANALKAVKADKTVYAAFATKARSYTATFYDDKGNIIGTAQAGYGTKVTPPDATKDGYTFDGWTPSDLTLYGDTSFVGSWSKLSGYGLVTILTDLPGQYSYERKDYAISNDGKYLAVGTTVADNNLTIYDLSGDTPTAITTPAASGAGLYKLMYTKDDTKLMGLGKATSSDIYRYEFDAVNAAYTSTKTVEKTSSSTTEFDAFAISPVNSGYVLSCGKSTSAPTAKIFTGTSTINISATKDTAVVHAAYSPDGTYVAVSRKGGTVEIYNALSGSKVKTITTGQSGNSGEASFSADNSKIAIYVNTAPYVQVYDFASGTVLFNLSEYFSSNHLARFIPGTNDLLANTTNGVVRVFDASSNTPQEIENVPTYGSSNIGVKTNMTGTRIVLYDTPNKRAEVWSRY